jgi:hypothetical protein
LCIIYAGQRSTYTRLTDRASRNMDRGNKARLASDRTDDRLTDELSFSAMPFRQCHIGKTRHRPPAMNNGGRSGSILAGQRLDGRRRETDSMTRFGNGMIGMIPQYATSHHPTDRRCHQALRNAGRTLAPRTKTDSSTDGGTDADGCQRRPLLN